MHQEEVQEIFIEAKSEG